jgi:hypothetical protein
MPPTHYPSPPDRPSADRDPQPDLNQLVASVFAVLDQVGLLTLHVDVLIIIAVTTTIIAGNTWGLQVQRRR